jgi:hypothetical protein
MSESGWARLVMGGRIVRAELEAALDESNGYVWSDLVEEDGQLVLLDEVASYAMFQELETWLIEHGVPFDRFSGHAGEFGDMLAYWRPGMKANVDALSDEGNSDVYVAVGDVRHRLRAGFTAEQVGAWLDELFPEPAPLPPLELV